MGGTTSGGRQDARDAEDIRLLDADQYAELLAIYWPSILDRLRLRLSERDACEVASDVVDRLLGELRAGKRYSVPFRVVVHKVIDWKLKEFFRRGHDDALPAEWDAQAPDPHAEWEADYDFGVWIAPLSHRQQEALRLRYAEGLEVKEIAGRLGIDPNACDQLLWRAREKLKSRSRG